MRDTTVKRFWRFSLLILAWLGVSATAFAWDCHNAHRVRVVLETGASAHSDEIRIELDSSFFPAIYDFTPLGDDVRVVLASDNTTPVDHVVTGWDGVTRTGTVYVRPGPIAANSSLPIYIYFGDDTLAGASDPTSVFTGSGVRLTSRSSSANPGNPTDGRSAFAAATTTIYDAVRTSVTGLNNRALGGGNGNFGWCVSALLYVSPANAGNWEFRYGGDFGRGGHLYVRETELEEQWNDDLWWAGNYANTNETLSGTIDLPEGWHRYEALGFEGCCDGGVGFQARAPGGPWRDLSTANFTLRPTRCIPVAITVTRDPVESCPIDPSVTKSVTIISDPFGKPSPYALPGSVVEYSLIVTNTGQKLSQDTVILTDLLPPEVKLIVSGASAFTFTDGATSSNLGLSWVDAGNSGDDVSFSTDGVDFAYIPSPDGDGADPNITHVRFSLSGAMRASVTGITDPSFSIRYRVIIK